MGTFSKIPFCEFLILCFLSLVFWALSDKDFVLKLWFEVTIERCLVHYDNAKCYYVLDIASLLFAPLFFLFLFLHLSLSSYLIPEAEMH